MHWRDFAPIELKGKGSKPYEWKHGWIPKTSEAAKIKAKKKSGSADDGAGKGDNKISRKAFNTLSEAQKKRVKSQTKAEVKDGGKTNKVKEKGTSEGKTNKVKSSDKKDQTKTTNDKQEQEKKAEPKLSKTIMGSRDAAQKAGLPNSALGKSAKISEFIAKLQKEYKFASGEKKTKIGSRIKIVQNYLNQLEEHEEKH